MTRIVKGLCLPFLLALSLTVFAEPPKNPGDGEIYQDKDGALMAWDSVGKKWLDPEGFWLAYAQRRGGLTWGRGKDYPPYNDVSERDLFLVELEQGVCLMEFWHSRWRRAQDVRRWDTRFNDYGGCPYVFD